MITVNKLLAKFILYSKFQKNNDIYIIKLQYFCIFNSIIRWNYLGNGSSVQSLHFLVLPQYSSFSDFPCLHKWPIRLVLTNSAVLPWDITGYLVPSRTGIEHVGISEFHHSHAYLSQGSDQVWYSTTTSALVY